MEVGTDGVCLAEDLTPRRKNMASLLGVSQGIDVFSQLVHKKNVNAYLGADDDFDPVGPTGGRRRSTASAVKRAVHSPRSTRRADARAPAARPLATSSSSCLNSLTLSMSDLGALQKHSSSGLGSLSPASNHLSPLSPLSSEGDLPEDSILGCLSDDAAVMSAESASTSPAMETPALRSKGLPSGRRKGREEVEAEEEVDALHTWLPQGCSEGLSDDGRSTEQAESGQAAVRPASKGAQEEAARRVHALAQSGDCVCGLQGADLGCLDVPAVLDSLSKAHVLASIHVLDLSGNEITHVGLAPLLRGLRGAPLAFLDLSDNPLKRPASELLAAFLADAPALAYLNVSHCRLRDNACALLRALQTHPLVALNISHNKLTRKSGYTMGQMVGVSHTLQALELEGNNLETEGGMHLLHALKLNTSLKYLNFSWNESHRPRVSLKLRALLARRTAAIPMNAPCASCDAWVHLKLPWLQCPQPETAKEIKRRSSGLNTRRLKDQQVRRLKRPGVQFHPETVERMRGDRRMKPRTLPVMPRFNVW
mmetsp:Transcript_31916/g.80032  ORF Transcript_31916/g.80032 Transcript_31916/m.80032 type:complete len:538 (-) Transcript_31916:144-1757(-)|eukprot:CAMPEP_0177649354 /NCGR_PEP_ID=MMETSP0447-20121125/11339_1 /TAXON_ID=0 /ORGANISM="Stygamoeba regulata, Strain BSH-02190019" /LENGTH=537 /DNA_ID=CAMNT_0019152101 /DNA_START=170 /DNA_END=1780 /DNA_ORIENTATION=-